MQTTARTEGANTLQELRRAALHAAPIAARKERAKRIFDICFSSALLIGCAPLFVILAIAISATSPGPVFYSSNRMGRGGVPIRCIKFRTMFRDAEERLEQLLDSDPAIRLEWTTYQKLKNDPRITPLGRLLRRTSMDELPQFWNVLKGELSVVGPRPPTIVGPMEEAFQEIRSIYGADASLILSVRPGITGVWQTSGRSGIPLEKRRKMEANYVRTRSFWRDLILIVKTIPAVLFSRGAW